MGIAEITFSVSVDAKWFTNTVTVEIEDEALEDYGMTMEDFINEDPEGEMEEILMDLAFETVPENYVFEQFDDISIIFCPSENGYDAREDERNPRNLGW